MAEADMEFESKGEEQEEEDSEQERDESEEEEEEEAVETEDEEEMQDDKKRGKKAQSKSKSNGKKGGKQSKSSKKKKNKAPKKPKTDWDFFRDEFKEKHKEELKGLHIKEFAKRAAAAWGQLTAEEKRPYKDKALHAKEKWAKQFPEAAKKKQAGKKKEDGTSKSSASNGRKRAKDKFQNLERVDKPKARSEQMPFGDAINRERPFQ